MNTRCMNLFTSATCVLEQTFWQILKPNRGMLSWEAIFDQSRSLPGMQSHHTAENCRIGFWHLWVSKSHQVTVSVSVKDHKVPCNLQDCRIFRQRFWQYNNYRNKCSNIQFSIRVTNPDVLRVIIVHVEQYHWHINNSTPSLFYPDYQLESSCWSGDIFLSWKWDIS